MHNHLPPQSKEAEQVVIAAALRVPEYRADILGQVPKEDFYFAANQLIFDSIRTLHDRNQPSDTPAVFQLITERGQAEEVGMKYMQQTYLDFAGHRESVGNWRHYAEVIREKAKARHVIYVCTEAMRDAYSPVGSMEELIGDTEQKLFAIAAGRGDSDAVTLAQAMREALHEMDERIKGRGTRPVSTGFDSLDGVLGGFRKGQLTVLAARPAVGKTSLALGFALHSIRHSPSMFFSMEMSRLEIANRALAVLSSVGLHAITGNRDFKPGEYADVCGAAKDTPAHLWIHDKSHLSVAEVASRVRKGIRKDGVKLVLIDYLQRMNHDRKAGGRHDLHVGDTAKQLKTLARDCEIPVVCLAQLNRQVESRGDGKPKLSDLRDSGEIEQEADNVILLHPHEPSAYDPSTQVVDVLIEKQRNGPTACISLTYRRPFTRFEG